MAPTAPRLLLALFSLVLAGCGERKAQVGSPNAYDRAGLSFNYPGNWVVTDEGTSPDDHYVVLESTGSAVVVVHAFEGDASEIEAFATDFSKTTREGTPATVKGSKYSAKSLTDDGFSFLTENFEVTLLGETVPHTRTYRRKRFGSKVCFVICQSPDEDREKAKPGFEQIASTFEYTAPAAEPASP